MKRGYPRFLFSDPKNVATPGPFIVHTMEPKFIVKVTRVPLYGEKRRTTHNGKICLTFVEDGGPVYSDELEKVTNRLYIWLEKQVKAGEIDF